MKKKLNEASVMNELRGSSLFFPPSTDEEPAADEVDQVPESKSRKRTTRARKTAKTAPAIGDASPPFTDLEDASLPLTDHAERIETVRNAVKQLGKEATLSRFTQQEKTALGDLVHTYKRSGIRTSENEVIRIALNWLLEDYHQDGQNSVLACVLTRLNA